MLCEILKDFPGSQDGTVTEQFVAGTRRELSAYLAGIVIPAGWARPVVEIDNKAIITEGRQRGKRP